MKNEESINDNFAEMKEFIAKHPVVFATISDVFSCKINDIKNIAFLQKGMTNHSFVFTVDDKKYIFRVPGEGTDRLINRKEEAEVYKTIKDYGLCSNPVYFNKDNGFKITEYLEGVRPCNPFCLSDLERCMKLLRYFHSLKLKVPHSFDIFDKISFYESIWGDNRSAYDDYYEVKRNVFSLKEYIDASEKEICLTHIDAVPDNFLFYKANARDGMDETELLQLTDWEYSGMQDPHIDLAMFCVYSNYEKENCDRLIDIYFNNQCKKETRIKIYCYISACGLLWSNWCEYKHKLGIDFGDYSVNQYQYAKEFYKIVKSQL